MRLSRALEEKRLDLRLRDKLVHEGELEQAEVSSYLNGLSDDSAGSISLASPEDEEASASTEQQSE